MNRAERMYHNCKSIAITTLQKYSDALSSIETRKYTLLMKSFQDFVLQISAQARYKKVDTLAEQDTHSIVDFSYQNRPISCLLLKNNLEKIANKPKKGI